MNKLHLLILLIVTFSIISCGDDDDGSGATLEITEENLVGTWQWTSATTNGESMPLSDCEKLSSATYSISENEQNIAVFTEHYTENNTCVSSESSEYNWSLNGPILTENFGIADIRIYEVIELTETTLKLKEEDVYMEDGETIQDVFIATFSRK